MSDTAVQKAVLEAELARARHDLGVVRERISELLDYLSKPQTEADKQRLKADLSGAHRERDRLQTACFAKRREIEALLVANKPGRRVEDGSTEFATTRR